MMKDTKDMPDPPELVPVEARRVAHSCFTYPRWRNFLNQHGIAKGDPQPIELVGQFSDLCVYYADSAGRSIVLAYKRIPIVVYWADVSTKVVVHPPEQYDPDRHETLINSYLPEWLEVQMVGGKWVGDVTIDGVTRRYDLFYQDRPRVWRRAALVKKHQDPPKTQMPSPDTPVSIWNGRDWTRLATITVDQWLKEPKDYRMKIAGEIAVIIDAMEQQMSKPRRVLATLQEAEQRALNQPSLLDIKRRLDQQLAQPDPFPEDDDEDDDLPDGNAGWDYEKDG